MPLFPFRGCTPVVPASAWIAPTATVIGRVTLGEDVSIWFGAVVRGDMHDITIGPATNIQDNAVVHVTKDKYPVVMGARITVGHRAVIHGCVIEDDCLIGVGAIIMDGAHIGRETLIGAGALVPPGKSIPPRSLVVGVPGKVVRSLTDRELAAMKANNDLYRQYQQSYRQEWGGDE